MATEPQLPQVAEWGYFIGGALRTEGTPFEVRSPYDGQLVGVAFEAPEYAIEEVIRQAQAARPAMASMPTYEKVEILGRIAKGVEARQQEFVRLLALEAGKPIKA